MASTSPQPASPFPQTEDDLLPVLAELQEREPIFHRSALPSTTDAFAQLIAPGYWEVGASGRCYSREFILRHLADHPPVDAGAAGWQSSGFACRRLGTETFLLTYTLQQGPRRTRRATIWQRTSGHWQILYHQGTIVADNEDDTAPVDTAQS